MWSRLCLTALNEQQKFVPDIWVTTPSMKDNLCTKDSGSLQKYDNHLNVWSSANCLDNCVSFTPSKEQMYKIYLINEEFAVFASLT